MTRGSARRVRIRNGGYRESIGERWTAKILLADKVNELLDQRQLNQSAAAEHLGISQSKISAIRNHKLNGISMERLLHVLVGLNQRVSIVIKPAETPRQREIEVVV
ncbi:helix-turn-helix domain-containing protein [Steroidobacter sp.]|uniref:helix-turn-helix domain-containing protein n=1 Tax=Steroidobacter sp. TaxID=1978227 RepID=UPI001A41C980|nr:helix-turn-helix transcriptional regulator [Steroidobacter sp.]MBL8270559.1 XRE family transcriptional regulator [Steroidobacter sp.]